MTELSDKELLAALGISTEAKKQAVHTPKEARIIAGFEEIQKFVEEHGRLPKHGEDNDIFERLYAVRLDRLRAQKECRELLVELDEGALLDGATALDTGEVSDLDDAALLAELGVGSDKEDDITKLKHVRPRSEVRAAEEIANRTKCSDFETFKPLFKLIQQELGDGVRETRKFVRDAGFQKADIEKGQFFILGGQTVYVAEVGETIKAPNGDKDARLRLIYDNGTESNILLRSLQRALYKDELGRRISEPAAGPLFGSESSDEDSESGTIYVLRSKSDHPTIAANRDIIHKIGVTGGDVEKRIGNAKIDPTFLLADVEIIAEYKLYNINRTKLESLIHRFFSAVRLDLEIEDRFGHPVKPREWFVVPLSAIDEAVARLQDKSLTQYAYDTETAMLVKLE